ncbi:MAG: FKBP-type peptidyl-prolyl cis-trans isomerase [Alphaproteobacteria bacterium]
MRPILTAALGLTLLAMPLAACKPAGAPRVSAERNLADGKAFLEANGKKTGVVTLPSGVQYTVVKSGPATNPKPATRDEVKVHYEGKLLDGKVFDSSYERGVPASFALNRVIPGWTDALSHMHVGDEWIIYIPSELAYGEHPEQHGADDIPPNAVLTFRVELLDVLPAFGPGGDEPPIAPKG